MKHLKLNKKIVVLSLLLLMSLVGLVGTTIAWLTSTGSKQHEFTMGEVSYLLEEQGTITTDKVVPGQNIFTGYTFKLTNSSTIITQVRIKIEAIDKGTQGSENNAVVLANVFNIGFGDNAVWKTSASTPDDGYYYYDSEKKADANLGQVAVATKEIMIPLNMSFDGSKVGNTYKGKQYTIKLTFEAKQLSEVAWSEMGNINFETGLAK